MIPFWQSHSPLEIALNALLDTVWVFGYVFGFGVALWQHFAAPGVPSVDPVDVALPSIELTTEAAPAKPKRQRKKPVVLTGS